MINQFEIKEPYFHMIGLVSLIFAVLTVVSLVVAKWRGNHISYSEWMGFLFGFLFWLVQGLFCVFYNISYYYHCERVDKEFITFVWFMAFQFEFVVLAQMVYNCHLIYTVAKTGILPSEARVKRWKLTQSSLIILVTAADMIVILLLVVQAMTKEVIKEIANLTVAISFL